KMTPTTPEEVNAYSKQQVDDKAEQALKDAKAIAENADNIKEGIIDVSAIPLRTSITGARLEWDGVNGLVQYDAQGNPVSWLDIDANAHFANAFLSGRIEALEGYFGKNKNATIGDDGLTIKRPDGAIWMRNGLVYQDYNINGYDPYLMDYGNETGAESKFRAFDDNYQDSWYTRIVGTLDGRGDGTFYYDDIRDASLGYSVRFQRYEFVHSARYLKITYQIANNSRVNQHRFRLQEISSVPSGAKPIQTEITYADGDRGTKNIVIDLGVPSYTVRQFDIRLGWLKNGGVWGDKNSLMRFRIPRMSQSDYID